MVQQAVIVHEEANAIVDHLIKNLNLRLSFCLNYDMLLITLKRKLENIKIRIKTYKYQKVHTDSPKMTFFEKKHVSDLTI